MLNNLSHPYLFHSQTPYSKTKFETDDIVEVFTDGVKRLTGFKKIEKDLVVPKVLLKSNTLYCKTVKIFYELEVDAILAGLHKKIKLFFPIVVGSVPLKIDPTRSAGPKVSIEDPSMNDDISNPAVPLLESRELQN